MEQSAASAATSPGARRTLYPDNEPTAFGWLPRDGEHEIYYEECGAPDGRPAVVLHGGPGGATNPTMRRFLDPSRWRMLLFDQRGCGRSRPNACLEDNTTWDLIRDIERLRVQCGIDRWTVFGGSWGSTLALAYAITHPERVSALILRGVFLLTQKELRLVLPAGRLDAVPGRLGEVPRAHPARGTRRDDARLRQASALARPRGAGQGGGRLEPVGGRHHLPARARTRARPSSTSRTSPPPSPGSSATTSWAAASSPRTAGS